MGTEVFRKDEIPSITQQHSRLQTEIFDLLVIGGGATGAGIALDAVSRGLSVALVEADDFSSGTSSRSTKLIHGGVRYLEKAVMQFDRGQYHLVREALHERKCLLNIAPHLNTVLPILTPLYSWYQLPYYWAGLKVYDWISGGSSLRKSEFLTKKKTVQAFPGINQKGLIGSVLYYDGQFNDSRMNLSIALTAAQYGAAISNHLKVQKLLKDKKNVCGVRVVDTIDRKIFEIRSHSIINATGPFSDVIRQMDNPLASSLVAPSLGVHVVLDGDFCCGTGMLIPETDDGRVLFLLPWEGKTLAGTTDTSCTLNESMTPKKTDVEYILRHLNTYLNTSLCMNDVQASWSGLRPLVNSNKYNDTKSLSRDHFIETSESGLISITGGKWTTYRKMAEDAVNTVMKQQKKPFVSTLTENISLIGAENYEFSLSKKLATLQGIDEDIACHLAHNYGDRSWIICSLMEQGYGTRLAPGYCFTEAEALYGIRYEYARTPADLLGRRMRLAFLDHSAAEEAAPRVLELLKQEFQWNSSKLATEEQSTLDFLLSMHC